MFLGFCFSHIFPTSFLPKLKFSSSCVLMVSSLQCFLGFQSLWSSLLLDIRGSRHGFGSRSEPDLSLSILSDTRLISSLSYVTLINLYYFNLLLYHNTHTHTHTHTNGFHLQGEVFSSMAPSLNWDLIWNRSRPLCNTTLSSEVLSVCVDPSAMEI